ncbi:2-C-methyl-D-erythritol 4-phosphate cytidylyltransferase [Brumimicrobium glaciale]|uniref:2-C-methyl-D-erythritol 4-phosphate cytidylyltransferase n=1 Tax=Brumimicrobium glaciale TaxID=200475 RepID=A0A4Q4KS39_9FLAO|nr:2-C-methyl-D-erythritol 4-phosphate cytidylyltransferase [Brumimicrobium glaciale]RYM35762.1 2-C-methyl-D-erythritol 4-phosphate cytidylyltransferase [Brumimicrobium glaciale]
MKQSVIITAGGIGKRMKSDLPKQYISVQGLPVLMHTINKFYAYDAEMQIVISLPKDFIQMWKDLCEKHEFNIPHEITEGGIERYHSIKNALQKVKGEIVMVHDAVRPLVSIQTISNVTEKAKSKGAAIPVLPIKDTLRKGDSENSQHQDRSEFWIVQTPQAFKLDLLQEAYQIPYSSAVTDDASLVEAMGKQVFLTEGNEENIKITTPFDLKLVEFLLEK